MSVELKLKQYTAKEIAAITGGKLVVYGGDVDQMRGILSTDSREITDGMIFAAIKGENMDGNSFIPSALEKGSDIVICQYVPEEAKKGPKGFSAVLVDDTIEALGALASDYRSYSKAKFIGITGSVGKTTTKEFIASVASASYKTHKTVGNYNNLLGLPLTIFAIEPDDRVVVLEMGMSNRGEIERMSKIARPDLAVITIIGTSHLESLGTRENICRAKMEIRAGMPENGTLILNGDDPYLMDAAHELQKDPVFYSQHLYEAQFRAVNIREKENETIFDLLYHGRAVTNIEIPVIGKHNVNNALAAYAVGVELGMTDEAIRRGLSSFVGVEKRQKIYEIGKITVIDDCYNASPESMRAGIDVLMSIAEKKNAPACALLGDMLELGEDSRVMHYQVGAYAAQAKVEKLFCFGKNADVMAEAAITGGMRPDHVQVCVSLDKPDVMADKIASSLKEGSVLFVKASRGIAAERIIDLLKMKLI